MKQLRFPEITKARSPYANTKYARRSKYCGFHISQRHRSYYFAENIFGVNQLGNNKLHWFATIEEAESYLIKLQKFISEYQPETQTK